MSSRGRPRASRGWGGSRRGGGLHAKAEAVSMEDRSSHRDEPHTREVCVCGGGAHCLVSAHYCCSSSWPSTARVFDFLRAVRNWNL